jgi:hypothetical protein
MDNREFYIKLIERYINVARKSSLEEFYGKSSEVKITNLNFGVTSKSVVVSMTIKLGEIINEEVMEKDMAELLLIQLFIFLFRDIKITTVVNWDV